jgi:DNA-binding transcriptional LysR family regulator
VLLLEHARAVLDRLALAEAQVRALAGVHDGRVRVGSFFTALVHLSAEAGALLAERTPGVVVVDDLVDPATALARLARGELDLAVVFDHDFAPAAAPDGITLAPLFDDPVRLLVPAGHPLAATGRPIALAALAGETVLRSHDGEAARLTDHLLSAAGVNPELLAAGHGDEPVETQALVAAGRGVAFTYELTVLVSRHPLAVLPLADPPATRRVFLAHLDGPMPPPVAAVRDALVAAGAARRPATGPAPRRAALQRPLA